MKGFFHTIRLLLIFVLTVVAFPAGAQQLPDPMSPPRLVNDFAHMLSDGQRDALENKLVEFDRTTSTQITIVTVDDLQGMDRADYAARLFDQWGIGRGGNNNGILILIKPKTADSDGQVFISTGYGLEGAVPDALAGRIVDYDILPAFREGDYYKGLDQATTTLISLTKGEFTAEEYLAKNENPMSGILATILVLAFIIIVLAALFGKRGGKGGGNGGYTVDRHGGRTIIPPIFPGSFGGGSRGGGGFGGFSGGGGFGGFGGGMTGGGGAGGSW